MELEDKNTTYRRANREGQMLMIWLKIVDYYVILICHYISVSFLFCSMHMYNVSILLIYKNGDKTE